MIRVFLNSLYKTMKQTVLKRHLRIDTGEMYQMEFPSHTENKNTSSNKTVFFNWQTNTIFFPWKQAL